MPLRADIRHAFGLVLATLSGLGAVAALACLVLVVVAAADGRGPAAAPLGACSLFALLLGAFLFRRGIAIRARAMAAGSTLYQYGGSWDGGTGRTSRTQSKRPSFLDKQKPDPE